MSLLPLGYPYGDNRAPFWLKSRGTRPLEIPPLAAEEAAHGADHWKVAVTLHSLGETYRMAGDAAGIDKENAGGDGAEQVHRRRGEIRRDRGERDGGGRERRDGGDGAGGERVAHELELDAARDGGR